MLSKSILNALNDQINKEMYSAYLYLAMSTGCAERNLPGFANWLRVQSKEENAHAMKMYGYVHDHGNHVELQAIEKPPTKFKSPREIFEHVLEHEQKVTGMIRKIYELAFKENDYATQIFMQWFVTEQVEEEKNAAYILDRLKLIGDHVPALIMFDKEVGARAAD